MSLQCGRSCAHARGTSQPSIAVGETAGLPWFALELVHGPSLAALLAELRARFGAVQRIDAAALPEVLRSARPVSAP